MKVDLLARVEDGKPVYHDLYIDQKLIKGFFLPQDIEEQHDEVVSLVYPELEILTVKSTKKLQEFLIDRFVDVDSESL